MKETKQTKKMIAYCGLDCEKCDARTATINNDGALREKTAELWSKMNGVPITPEMINCMGCRMNGVKTPFCDSMCEIRKCALEKKVNTCGDCANVDRCEKVGEIINNNKQAEENLKKRICLCV